MIARKTQKIIYNILILCFLIGGATYVCSRFIHLGNIEYTDNAQVKQHITPINTRVPGFIKKICFEEYQQVRKGDTLVIIVNPEKPDVPINKNDAFQKVQKRRVQEKR